MSLQQIVGAGSAVSNRALRRFLLVRQFAAEVTHESYPTSSSLSGVTLYGVVFELTPTGQMPLADTQVYCDACGEFGHTSAFTDANGFYSDTRFDIQLVRR
jgi:hypothetical protein